MISNDDRAGSGLLPVIAVDVAGGDRGQDVTVPGAVAAAAAGIAEVILVGPPDSLPDPGALPARVRVHASGGAVRGVEDPLSAIRRNSDSSVSTCCRLVAGGVADGMVSVGPTGATVAAARVILGRMDGVRRPAIAGVLPDVAGRPSRVLLDVGANDDCRASWLLDFARLGARFAAAWLGKEMPSVGLLNVGAENHKGNGVVREAYDLLTKSELIFSGNVEGNELFDTVADVIVADGFTGNVALKVAEGTARLVARSAGVDTPIARLPEAIGGFLLLGVNGVVVVGHGASGARAVEGAVAQAARAVELGVVDAMRGRPAPLPTELCSRARENLGEALGAR